MVITFYGTSAELIKMYGIIKNLPRDQQLLICTSQQHAGLQKVHKQLEIEPDVYLATGWKGNDVANMKQMLGLMLKVHGSFASQFTSLKRQIKSHDREHNTKSIVLVHGDTLTTVVGAYLGRTLNLPVAHIEAGLRSGSWKNPFPEELDRRIVAKIARIHFAPNDLAEENLRNESAKGELINTTFNTAKDAIEQSDRFVSDGYADLKLPDQYCLVLLHRTELLENRQSLESILKTIRDHADKQKHIVFTMHTTTSERIKSYGFEHYLEHPYIRIIPKQPYFDFMAIVKAADYIVTDGGGLQEDSFFLGIPVIVHRERTERQEGLGFNASISKMDVSKVAEFLDDHKDKKDLQGLADETSPSKVVTDYLFRNNYIAH
jgi:UDP-N-acetylglucosamine 2-epimerase (non-hydrolysing)